MKEFKVNKFNAIKNATIQVAYQKAEKIIDSLILRNPDLAIPLTIIYSSAGVRIAYRQEKLNQFTEHLLANHDVYKSDLFNSDQFQDGLQVFVDTFFKLRSQEKLILAQNIFDEFSVAKNKVLFPLERYDDTLVKISQNGIRFLGFIHQRIPELIDEYTRQEMKRNGNTTDNKSYEEWREIYGNKDLDPFIEFFIEQESNKMMTVYKGEDKIIQLTKIKQEIRNNFAEAKSELEQLGVGKIGYVDGGWGGGHSNSI